MKSIREMMMELVAVRSDSGTALERDAAQKIHDLVREDPYFQQNPQMCGVYDNGDLFGRPVIWALKKGRTGRTVVLTGHYDAVETTCYGALEPLALEPEKLRRAMLETGGWGDEIMRDLNDPNWVFGRGAADMKSGVAINLRLLAEYETADNGILFTAVCDEENLSAGARQAIPLYEELRERFGLEYVYAAITEPIGLRRGEPGEPMPVLDGASGKLLPVAVVKGRLAHSAYVMNGLNSALILAEIIRRVDLSTDFLSSDLGVCNQPPATQIFFDMKKDYDVSTPEYSAAGFNMTFYGATDPMEQVDKLRRVCEQACADVVARYNAVFDQMQSAGQLYAGFRVEYHPEVMLLEELKERLQKQPGYEAAEAAVRKDLDAQVRSGTMNMQKAGIHYIRALMDLAHFPQPTVVIGVVPPYYPAVTNRRLSRDIAPMLERTAQAVRDEGMTLRIIPYSQGMNDTSFMSCMNPESAVQVMENMAVSKELFDIDFAALSRLNIPTQLIGPAAKNVHQMAERVFMPDVEENVPRLLRELIRQA